MITLAMRAARVSGHRPKSRNTSVLYMAVEKETSGHTVYFILKFPWVVLDKRNDQIGRNTLSIFLYPNSSSSPTSQASIWK